ncbi:longevity-assurance protein 1 [Agrocybe pediades]|nr:longevity-assurance protein 1 [Agrocybe pediades]
MLAASRSTRVAPLTRRALRWAVDPASAFKILIRPVMLYAVWTFLPRQVRPDIPNPFARIFLLSGYITTSSPDRPLYRKTWWDLAFVAYYSVFFAFFRTSFALNVSRPAAKYFRVRRQKIDRFCEHLYSVVYFFTFGAWGYRVMQQLPTAGFNTEEFWIGYPHWAMRAELKSYYLMQLAYWIDQSLVMLLGLEKPRRDYAAMLIHHPVTLWLVGGSYVCNHTYTGNAVFLSMDIPDAFLSFSQLLNAMQWNTAKVYAFAIFYVIWGYCRHYLNIIILWSVWTEMPTKIPEFARTWDRKKGLYAPGWMRMQIFVPLALLQILNIYWYYLMTKILIKGFITKKVEDARSDDEGEDEAVNENTS